MARQSPDLDNEVYLRNGKAWRAESFPIHECTADLDPLTGGVMLSTAVPLQAGDTVTNVTFKSGATAADTPTAYAVALYSNAATPALLAQSADQETAAWAANTVKTIALATAQTVTVPDIYYVGIWMAATDLVSLIGRSVGIAGAAASVLGGKILAQTSGSSLTDTAPATIATPTAVATIPWVAVT